MTQHYSHPRFRALLAIARFLAWRILPAICTVCNAKEAGVLSRQTIL